MTLPQPWCHPGNFDNVKYVRSKAWTPESPDVECETILVAHKTVPMLSANECDAALEIESDSIEVLARLDLTHSKDTF